jgi:hypothetical protein
MINTLHDRVDVDAASVSFMSVCILVHDVTVLRALLLTARRWLVATSFLDARIQPSGIGSRAFGLVSLPITVASTYGPH